MKTIANKTKSKLALAILAIALSEGVSAEGLSTEGENAQDDSARFDMLQNETLQQNSSNEGTYWGIGIGSVLGAVIAGPPGAAIGATLGGSIGWGQDKDADLDQSQSDIDQQKIALEQHKTQLQRHQHELKQSRAILNKSRRQVSELSRSNALQSARLADIKADNTQGGGEPAQTVLKEIIEHYAQEVYFRHGESDVPNYAQARLDRLTRFLKSHPKLNVVLKGFTDSRGSAEFNAALAQSRVDGIKAVLLDLGIEAQRITTQAIGETESVVASSQSEKTDARNYILDRRVSIELSIPAAETQPIASIGEVTQ